MIRIAPIAKTAVCRTARAACSLSLLVALLACGDKPPSSPDAVVDRWEQGGLEVAMLESVEQPTLGKAECRETVAAGVQATLCSYESEQAAAAARKPGLASVGEHTGVALSQGKLLLVLADRDNKDPDGRKINQLSKAFFGK